MTPDEYLKSVLSKYRVDTSAESPTIAAARDLVPTIKEWAGVHLNNVTFSGSFAKGTAVRGTTDVDLFISIRNECTETLRTIYETLFKQCDEKKLSPRRQNVSVRVTFRGLTIDLVPGHKHPGTSNDHSLYRSKVSTWMQTNVAKHISTVQSSGRIDEIRIIKIWRMLHGLDLPSFYLELTVLNALVGQPINALSNNTHRVLLYLAETFPSARVIDPANSNNIISDDLTYEEKRMMSAKARGSAKEQYWEKVVW